MRAKGFTPTPERGVVLPEARRRRESPRLVSGFTVVEVALAIAIFSALITVGIIATNSFERTATLNTDAEEAMGALRLARSKTLSSTDASQYGVYIDTATNPDRYILYRGADYATGSVEQIFLVSQKVEFYDIALSGGGSEVTFQRLSGATANSGTISLRFVDNPSDTKTIYIEEAGDINKTTQSAPSDDDRIKDSRHTHIAYTRTIDISPVTSESIFLIFPADSVTQEIIIEENLQVGQLFWEGDIVVGGETQHIKIHTHHINDVTENTIFSIHRDQRYNTKTLQIDVSGDPAATSDLIEYDATGNTTQGNSAFVSAPSWQ